MIIEIPGRDAINITRLIIDYNGTLACDGIISEKIKEIIKELAKTFEIYVLTADTYGSAAKQCKGLPVVLKTFPNGEAGAFKEQITDSLNPHLCACIGNGFNDIKMFKKAALSIGVIDREGICAEFINCSDIIVTSIQDGLNLFLDTRKIIADLRY